MHSQTDSDLAFRLDEDEADEEEEGEDGEMMMEDDANEDGAKGDAGGDSADDAAGKEWGN